jgi:predicted TIM-barrel fold metal-dependent hydrolase
LSQPEVEMRHAIGVDKMMWGWDYPHIEAEEWLAPQDNLRRIMQGVPEDELRAMLAGNSIQAYGLDAAQLMPIAERVGPKIGDLMSA